MHLEMDPTEVLMLMQNFVIENKEYQLSDSQSLNLEKLFAIEKEIAIVPWSLQNFIDCKKAGNCFYQLTHAEQLIGFAVMSYVLDEASLLNIGIAKAYQGKHLGTRLLDYILEKAQQQQSKSIFLEVRESNIRAQQLYLNAGFNEIDRRIGYYPAKQKAKCEDALIYAYTLF